MKRKIITFALLLGLIAGDLQLNVNPVRWIWLVFLGPPRWFRWKQQVHLGSEECLNPAGQLRSSSPVSFNSPQPSAFLDSSTSFARACLLYCFLCEACPQYKFRLLPPSREVIRLGNRSLPIEFVEPYTKGAGCLIFKSPENGGTRNSLLGRPPQRFSPKPLLKRELRLLKDSSRKNMETTLACPTIPPTHSTGFLSVPHLFTIAKQTPLLQNTPRFPLPPHPSPRDPYRLADGEKRLKTLIKFIQTITP